MSEANQQPDRCCQPHSTASSVMIEYSVEGFFNNLVNRAFGDLSKFYDQNVLIDELSASVIVILDTIKTIINNENLAANLRQVMAGTQGMDVDVLNLNIMFKQAYKLVLVNHNEFIKALNHITDILLKLRNYNEQINTCPPTSKHM